MIDLCHFQIFGTFLSRVRAGSREVRAGSRGSCMYPRGQSRFPGCCMYPRGQSRFPRCCMYPRGQSRSRGAACTRGVRAGTRGAACTRGVRAGSRGSCRYPRCCMYPRGQSRFPGELHVPEGSEQVPGVRPPDLKELTCSIICTKCIYQEIKQVRYLTCLILAL